MQRSISESVIVISGPSSGIGRATALELAKQNASIVLASRSREGLASVAEECQALGARVLVVPTDVADETQVEELARATIQNFGRIDVWINNAGVIAYSAVENTPIEVFHQVIDTNFFGCVNGTKAVLPCFRKQGHGILINISSSAGKVGAPYLSAYSASKFAINGFSESVRMELRDAPDIHVCTILPGSTDTPLFWHAANYTGRAVKPVEPMQQPEDVARAIVKCITHPEREVVVGRLARAAVWSRSLPRALTERIVARKTHREHFIEQEESPGEGNLFEPVGPYHSVSGFWREMFPKERNWVMPTAMAVAAVAGFILVRQTRR